MTMLPITELFKIRMQDVQRRLSAPNSSGTKVADFRYDKFLLRITTAENAGNPVMDFEISWDGALYAPSTRVRISRTPQKLGGWNHYFLCPAVPARGQPVCGRRIRSLYLDVIGKRIACDRCPGLPRLFRAMRRSPFYALIAQQRSDRSGLLKTVIMSTKTFNEREAKLAKTLKKPLREIEAAGGSKLETHPIYPYGQIL